MKRYIQLLAISGLFMAFASCEKCVECTFEAEGAETITEEFCGKGHVYDNQLEHYESTGWDCEGK